MDKVKVLLKKQVIQDCEEGPQSGDVFVLSGYDDATSSFVATDL